MPDIITAPATVAPATVAPATVAPAVRTATPIGAVAYVLSFIEPAYPDRLQPRIIAASLKGAQELAEEAARESLTWRVTMGFATTTYWSKTPDRDGYRYAVTIVVNAEH